MRATQSVASPVFLLWFTETILCPIGQLHWRSTDNPMLTKPPSSAQNGPIAQNIRTMVELAQETRTDRTAVDRLTDTIARTAGSTAFIAAHAIWFTARIVLNSTRAASTRFPTAC